MNLLLKAFSAVLLLFLFLSCGKANYIKEKKGDETIISVDSDDAVMNKIIDNARKTAGTFLKALKNPKKGRTDFSIKYPFTADPGSKDNIEHIWLVNIKEKKGGYSGTVANEPFYIKKMKFGDTVKFDIHKISDWKYVENGYLVGGESIKLFYNKMSEEEKKEFNDEAGFKIKD